MAEHDHEQSEGSETLGAVVGGSVKCLGSPGDPIFSRKSAGNVMIAPNSGPSDFLQGPDWRLLETAQA